MVELAKTGNVTLSASTIGQTRSGVYRLREHDAGFKAEWETAVQEAADRLEAEARRRAVEGVPEPVFYQGEICGQVQRYSDLLLIFLLKGVRPEKYRENYHVTGEVKVSLAEEIKEARERAVRLADASAEPA